MVGSGSGTRSRRRSGLGVLFGPNTFNSCVQMIIRINIITWESNSVKLTNTSSPNVLSSKMVTPAYDYIVSTRPLRDDMPISQNLTMPRLEPNNEAY